MRNWGELQYRNDDPHAWGEEGGSHLEVNRVRVPNIYEWFVGLIGLGVAVWNMSQMRHPSLTLLILLFLLTVLLEAIPVPLGKAMGSLMYAVPLGTMVAYGSTVAIVVTVAAELAAPIVRRSRIRSSTWVFNAGQYGLSVAAMVSTYHWIHPLHTNMPIDWLMVAGLLSGAVAFLVVNHLLVNVLLLLRGSLSRMDTLQMLTVDGINFLVALPLAFLMILISPAHPLFGPIIMVPMLLVGQIIRLYRKMFVMQSVHDVTSKLAGEFDLDRICYEVAYTAKKLTYADVVVVFLYDEERQRLLPNVVFPPDAAVNFKLDGLRESDDDIIWRVVRDDRWIYVPNTQRDNRVRFHGAGDVIYHSMGIFPMQARGEIQGAIVCYSERSHAFGELLDMCEPWHLRCPWFFKTRNFIKSCKNNRGVMVPRVYTTIVIFTKN
jgi:hypothetical protein